MALRALKLGTRRSALARAQSAAVARALEQRHPGLTVELVGIDTRGDRILDQPLSRVEGKEFFTAEIDAALLRGQIDFTVHSFKDLSIERDARLHLAAVPAREPPYDVVVFAPDVPARLAAGEALTVGSSSPRRASFVPDFLREALPRSAVPGAAHAGGAPLVRLVELRGNVDSRLRRLREPHDSPRHLDAVVLAFAGLARLWGDQSLRPTMEPLLDGLPRMIVPLSICPTAPAQGALALECRTEDHETRALLAVLDDGATRSAVQAERDELAAIGGGCQQRFGAVSVQHAGLGELLFSREAHERGGELELQPTRVRWRPAEPLPQVSDPVRPWDGSAHGAEEWEPDAQGTAMARQELPGSEALFITHRRALPAGDEALIGPTTHVWVPGLASWRALAQRGVWVEGCADGFGFDAITGLLSEPWLGLPPPSRWLVLTHREAAKRWNERGAWSAARVLTPYRGVPAAPADHGPPADSTHVYWGSAAQFDRWRGQLGAQVHHACGPGKTYEYLREARLAQLHIFPGVQQWREWLGQ
jgi:hydroxymethylbilane synthase